MTMAAFTKDFNLRHISKSVPIMLLYNIIELMNLQTVKKLTSERPKNIFLYLNSNNQTSDNLNDDKINNN